jgi:hypothetical protein
VLTRAPAPTPANLASLLAMEPAPSITYSHACPGAHGERAITLDGGAEDRRRSLAYFARVFPSPSACAAVGHQLPGSSYWRPNGWQ